MARPRLLLRLLLNDLSLSLIDLSTSFARLVSLTLRRSFISSSTVHISSSRARSLRPCHTNQPTAALPIIPAKPKTPTITNAALPPPSALYSCARTAHRRIPAVRAMRLISNTTETTHNKTLCLLSKFLWLRGRSLTEDGGIEALARCERASSAWAAATKEE